MLGGGQALLQVVHQHRHGEGVGLGQIAGARFGSHRLVMLALLLVLQMLISTLCKDANHLPMHLHSSKLQP